MRRQRLSRRRLRPWPVAARPVLGRRSPSRRSRRRSRRRHRRCWVWATSEAPAAAQCPWLLAARPAHGQPSPRPPRNHPNRPCANGGFTVVDRDAGSVTVQLQCTSKHSGVLIFFLPRQQGLASTARR
eukprot:scaffold62750_cov52-Phaeocystis_antarctica.AAC.2